MRVVKLQSGEVERLIAELSRRYDVRDIPYGVQFRLPSGGVVNIYNSGKIVVSPNVWDDVKSFILQAMDGATGTIIGCDEAGKGELLGPVVVSCVRLCPEMYKEIRLTGVMDSKDISDILKIERELCEILDEKDVSVFLVSPLDYRRLHAHWRSINRILEYMFLNAASVLQPADEVVIDAFARDTLLKAFWRSLVFTPGAERFVAVAAASVIAKAEYIHWVRKFVPSDVVEIARRSDVPVGERVLLFVERGYDREILGRWLKPWKNMV